MNTLNTNTPESTRHAIKHFINKFEATREEEWCIGHLLGKDGSRCAIGMTLDERNAGTEETDLLWRLAQNIPSGPASINDGRHSAYPQPTPRQRVLAWLYDLLKGVGK